MIEWFIVGFMIALGVYTVIRIWYMTWKFWRGK